MGGFRRVLCATDLSDAADWAMRAADREARLHGAELILLHVVSVGYPGAPMWPPEVEEQMVRQERLASEIIETLVERAEQLIGRDAGTVSVIVEEGVPDETIVAQAEAVGADLIVVGSTGATRRRFFGGVAEKVVKHARIPVLVARAGGETGRILLATDFSSPDEPAAQLAAGEAVRRCASVVALHSLELVAPEMALGDPPMLMPMPLAFGAFPIEELREVARRRLDQTLASLGISGEVAVTQGPPVEAILAAAAEKHADLVVIGSSGASGVDRLLLGSVALRVVREAGCSVLVAPRALPARHSSHPRQPLAAV